MKDVGREKLKGPIIKDVQCNPIDESIRQIILSKIQPPLASYNGFFDRRDRIAAKGHDIRKYTKAMKGKGDRTMSLLTPPSLALEGSSRQYTVRRELGKGAFAPVYLVDSQLSSNEEEMDEDKPAARMGQGGFGIQRSDQEAVKMEEPPSAWEFYIIRQAKRRLGVSRASESIVEGYEMHLFSDECFLIEEFRNQGTLLDLVNVCRAEGGVMDEQLAMFFTIELFRTVEALHAKSLIHGDLKADNILVRLSFTSSDAWSAQYHRSGTNGWSDKGVTIIDFGRGIDMKAFKSDVQFIADWRTSEADCAEMREMRPWTYHVDYHGLAGIVHSMLFGKYLETVAERGATLGAGATKTYKIRESLKRYWQTEIWGDVFGLLLNPLAHLDGEEGRKLPVLVGMKGLRERMETYLEVNGEKGTGLKAGLRKLENSIKERRK
jgi:checkpoint serine/threonine-protein kinase